MISRTSRNQNLVPNGNFESFSSCPTTSGEILLAVPWLETNYCGNYSDYYNVCASRAELGVPNNVNGYQFAHSGSGYSGLLVYLKYDYREYIEAPLIDSLKANTCYHFEMYICLSNKSNYTIKDIGAYFSDTVITKIPGCNNLPFNPQVLNTTEFISDTLNWTLISGDFVAAGGEQFLIIGNFKNDANTQILSFDTLKFKQSYIYIDDVSLTLCSSTNTTEEEMSRTYIYPNPATDKIKISFPTKGIYQISNSIGQKLFSTTNEDIDISELSSGIYSISVLANDKKIKSALKFVKL